MAKFNQDKVIEQLDEMSIDEQVSFYQKVKVVVTTNILAHQKSFEEAVEKYQGIAEKINGN